MQNLLNSKNCVQLVWENNNLTDFIILIPDQQFKMLTLNEFNIYQIFKIGIGYPMNYKKCNHKIFTYLQLHKFGYKFNTFYDSIIDINTIQDRIKLHNKIQYQFDTDLLDYFKSVHDKLFIKSYLKLANLEYKENMTEEVVSSYLNDYQQEIHSHIIYNAINIKQFIRDKFNEDIEEIVLPKNEILLNDSVLDTFQQLTRINIKVEEVNIPKLPYVPGFLI